MEEYKYLDLTVDAFLKVLEEEEFLYSSFGIALQSYIPDSFRRRKKSPPLRKSGSEKGGAPLKIRLVKGANLAMEKVEASIKNYPASSLLHQGREPTPISSTC